jgi:hypothetical protein
LNNCLAYEHARFYGAGAFFDLNRTGGQAAMATDIQRGDECVVATPTRRREVEEVEFVWFRFSREEHAKPDRAGCRASPRLFWRTNQVGDTLKSRRNGAGAVLGLLQPPRRLQAGIGYRAEELGVAIYTKAQGPRIQST